MHTQGWERIIPVCSWDICKQGLVGSNRPPCQLAERLRQWPSYLCIRHTTEEERETYSILVVELLIECVNHRQKFGIPTHRICPARWLTCSIETLFGLQCATPRAYAYTYIRQIRCQCLVSCWLFMLSPAAWVLMVGCLML